MRDNKINWVLKSTSFKSKIVREDGRLEDVIPQITTFVFQSDDGDLLTIKSDEYNFITGCTAKALRIGPKEELTKQPCTLANIPPAGYCLKGTTYTLPKDGNFTESIPMGKTIGLPIQLQSDKITWSAPGGIKGIGPKPEPIKFYVGKDKMDSKQKETYISPFTGRTV